MTNDDKQHINEYKKEPQIITKDFLEDLARRGREQIQVLDTLLEELRTL